MQSVGPLSRTQPYNGSLLRFISDSQKYTSNLSFFRRYVLWRYTIGSGAINYRLIFNKDSENSSYWIYLFLQYFKNTVNLQLVRDVRPSDLPKDFREFFKFFANPQSFGELQIVSKTEVTAKLIGLYIIELQDIMKNSPVVIGSGFYVYKVSSVYPGLPTPEPGLFKPTVVPQIPFNSTTIAKDFNFAPFISTTGDSYLYSIFIRGGTKGPLFIDSDLHAYSSFEHEILLPSGVNFDIVNYENVMLQYIDPMKINIKNIQDKSVISMGNVFDLTEYRPIKEQYGQSIASKPFKMFNVILR